MTSTTLLRMTSKGFSSKLTLHREYGEVQKKRRQMRQPYVKTMTLCCAWKKIRGVDIHVAYCHGLMQLRIKVHLPGNKKGVWRTATVPNKSFLGSCNNLIRLLAMAFRYGGSEFKAELRYQAQKMAFEL